MTSSRPKILIFGARGRLGAALVRASVADGEVHPLGRAEGNLADPAACADRVRTEQPAIVINSAALTNVDLCETERDLARTVNADAAGALARACTEVGARLIQISTDYVFSGQGKEPYAEDDSPEPISWYGQTKLEGEQQVMAAESRHAVVRVAWVFGPDRDSFVDKAVQSSLRGEPVKAVADKWSSPSYTLDIADALRALFAPAAPGGIYHLCNRGVCTWRDWAEEGIRAAAALGAPVQTRTVEPLRLAELGAMVAPRPVYSPLSSARIEALTGRPMRPWPEAVAAYVRLLDEAGRLRVD